MRKHLLRSCVTSLLLSFYLVPTHARHTIFAYFREIINIHGICVHLISKNMLDSKVLFTNHLTRVMMGFQYFTRLATCRIETGASLVCIKLCIDVLRHGQGCSSEGNATLVRSKHSVY